MKAIFRQLLNHQGLSTEQAHEVMTAIAAGKVPGEQTAALLTAIQMLGTSPDELVGLRQGVLETGVAVHLEAERVIDIVGTGGDGKNTFNISTTAAFVTAGAGCKVAKHGNFASTSVSGASNVLQYFGALPTSEPEQLQRSLDVSGMAYLHAPLYAPGMGAVKAVRRALPFPTCFNLLGPLVNPARPQCQLLGVATLDQMRLYANVLPRLMDDYAIVTSLDGYDEISLTGPFKVATRQEEKIYYPQDLGLPLVKPSEIYGGESVEEAAGLMVSVLRGTATTGQQAVVGANAAMAIYVYEGGKQPLEVCLARAQRSLISGAALRAFEKFVKVNKQ